MNEAKIIYNNDFTIINSSVHELSEKELEKVINLYKKAGFDGTLNFTNEPKDNSYTTIDNRINVSLQDAFVNDVNLSPIENILLTSAHELGHFLDRGEENYVWEQIELVKKVLVDTRYDETFSNLEKAKYNTEYTKEDIILAGELLVGKLTNRYVEENQLLVNKITENTLKKELNAYTNGRKLLKDQPDLVEKFDKESEKWFDTYLNSDHASAKREIGYAIKDRIIGNDLGTSITTKILSDRNLAIHKKLEKVPVFLDFENEKEMNIISKGINKLGSIVYSSFENASPEVQNERRNLVLKEGIQVLAPGKFDHHLYRKLYTLNKKQKERTVIVSNEESRKDNKAKNFLVRNGFKLVDSTFEAIEKINEMVQAIQTGKLLESIKEKNHEFTELLVNNGAKLPKVISKSVKLSIVENKNILGTLKDQLFPKKDASKDKSKDLTL